MPCPLNYLREINAFRRLMERAPLSMAAQILWYILMDFDNRIRWAEEFSVDNDRLMALMNVSSRHTLFNAKKELEDAGLLTFTPGKKKSPSVGTSLLNLGRAIGLRVLPAQKATGYLSVTGPPGTLIPAGWQRRRRASSSMLFLILRLKQMGRLLWLPCAPKKDLSEMSRLVL